MDACDIAPSLQGDKSFLKTTANAFHDLAKTLVREGEVDIARLAFEAAAEIDLRCVDLQNSWGGPLNGQQGRQRLFLNLLQCVRLAAIVETGTYRGTTTEWLAENFAGPVMTCEIEPRWFLQARKRLAQFAHLSVHNEDSRAFLGRILPTLPLGQPTLFYLDAHWLEDLPLAEEVRLILAHSPQAIIAVDDFCVPFDAGYQWDDYGPGKRLTLELFEWLKDGACRFFFPVLPSSEETGARRGLCVIATDPGVIEMLSSFVGLRGADWRDWELMRATQRVVEREALVAARDEQARALEALVAARDEQVRALEALVAAGDEQVRALQDEIQRARADVVEGRRQLATTRAYAGVIG